MAARTPLGRANRMVADVVDGGSGRYHVFWLVLLLARSAGIERPDKDTSSTSLYHGTETRTATVLKERVGSAQTKGTARPWYDLGRIGIFAGAL